MNELLWLKRAWVDALHFQLLKRFGGLYGIRDDGVIESALARARNRWEYGPKPDLAALAAAYGYGLARSDGYSDGNKRIGFVAMAVFLDLNGWNLKAPESEVVRIMVDVANGRISEAKLAGWVRAHLQRTEGSQPCSEEKQTAQTPRTPRRKRDLLLLPSQFQGGQECAFRSVHLEP